MPCRILRPSLASLGWEGREGEEAGQVLARGGLVERLGRLGCNETVGRWALDTVPTVVTRPGLHCSDTTWPGLSGVTCDPDSN